ncbi:MAG TPA: efflux RND transporter periplasmic adaptor subunit [Gemmatimonadales bacterium]|nr:efflux RND transporter periplasmic adaptor subunit [Gemmatimonadales bacterium]
MSRGFRYSAGWSGPSVLLALVLLTGGALAAWKSASIRKSNEASAHQPEPVEAVTTAVAVERQYRQTTTSIGTVLALRSITLKNELAGTVRRVNLSPGQIVEEGKVLVGLDVAVEEADLQAQQARAALAETTLERLKRLQAAKATSQEEVDQASAARDVALAEMARIKAVIDRKTIRAPFRARVGMADVHTGQFLESGTQLTTLQGVERAANVDFTVAQSVAAALRPGDKVAVVGPDDSTPLAARITAIDARVDPTTRNALIRAELTSRAPAPGASVRVEIPVGAPTSAVAIPVSALRKGPGGDHVFVIAPDSTGKSRAHERQVISGPATDDEILIISGLKPNEVVATSGSFKLREGVLIAAAADSANNPNGKQQ